MFETEQDIFKFFDMEYKEPRMTCYYGPEDYEYGARIIKAKPNHHNDIEKNTLAENLQLYFEILLVFLTIYGPNFVQRFVFILKIKIIAN